MTSFPQRKTAFTLIELLTVIAIVGVLAAIIVPVTGKVRQSASKSTMTSNLRQIGIGTGLFAADHRDRMPGIYQSLSSGEPNPSFALGGGQSAYASYAGTGTENRSALQSNEQIGDYITRSKINIGGADKLYCSLLESPAFAAQRADGVYPTSLVLGLNVLADDNTTVCPFGTKGAGGSSAQLSMRFTRLGASFNASRRWMAIEVDQTTPDHIVGAGVSWRGDLPVKPVHGNGWLALMYDGSVTTLTAGDPRINNLTAPD